MQYDLIAIFIGLGLLYLGMFLFITNLKELMDLLKKRKNN